MIFAALFLAILSIITIKAQNLETRQIYLKSCIQATFGKEIIIKDSETFLKAIRDDSWRVSCLKNIEKIDFDKNTLLGIELNTGYCRTPLGREAIAVKNEPEKQFILKISYTEPQGLCRTSSRSEVWIRVQKIPDN